MIRGLNLFELLEGRRAEDLATQVLGFVLKHPQFRNVQQIFYAYLFRDGFLQGTIERGFEVTTQASYVDGRPDIELRGDSLHVLIENKFTAEYSGGDQMRRYCEILIKSEAKSRILVLLCPGIWEAEYKSLAVQQFGDSIKSHEDLCRHLETHSIIYRVFIWDSLLALLGTESLLLAELRQFISGRYLLSIAFSEEEVAMLKSTDIPDLLNKVFGLVDQIRVELNASGESFAGRMSQSLNYYGFAIKRNDFDFWMGYSLIHWNQFKTPVLLQIIKSPVSIDPKIAEPKLGELGFQQALDGYGKPSWYWPIDLRAGNETEVRRIASEVRAKVEAASSTTA